ncbi:MAG: hypothetical protein EPN62_00760 [Candidimonas sp.]|nr:MAG: hypothetical protein EPN77_01760 [Candidimonas sp.]TAM26861.1 MAG: hypothetical protein EPN62_00760 [Candidimonas sp.]
MRTIPLQSIPSQTLDVQLSNQNCTINVYQKTTGLYLDLLINNAAVKTAILCRDRVKLIRDEYLGFIGDLVFVDTQGLNDPDYTGLGVRFVLVYLESGDLS